MICAGNKCASSKITIFCWVFLFRVYGKKIAEILKQNKATRLQKWPYILSWRGGCFGNPLHGRTFCCITTSFCTWNPQAAKFSQHAPSRGTPASPFEKVTTSHPQRIPLSHSIPPRRNPKWRNSAIIQRAWMGHLAFGGRDSPLVNKHSYGKLPITYDRLWQHDFR